MAMKTFDELMQEKTESLHNSNMMNLVSLVRQCEDSIAESEHDIAQFKARIEEAKKLSESADLCTTDAVHELYNRKFETFKGKRW